MAMRHYWRNKRARMNGKWSNDNSNPFLELMEVFGLRPTSWLEKQVKLFFQECFTRETFQKIKALFFLNSFHQRLNFQVQNLFLHIEYFEPVNLIFSLILITLVSAIDITIFKFEELFLPFLKDSYRYGIVSTSFVKSFVSQWLISMFGFLFVTGFMWSVMSVDVPLQMWTDFDFVICP